MTDSVLYMSLELIVTQWDVNKTYARIFEELKAELIVTQWDVNLIDLMLKKQDCHELIVTQWDVNFDIYRFFSCLAAGINSYIVGCK